jgi:hypothetical protein
MRSQRTRYTLHRGQTTRPPVYATQTRHAYHHRQLRLYYHHHLAVGSLLRCYRDHPRRALRKWRSAIHHHAVFTAAAQLTEAHIILRIKSSVKACTTSRDTKTASSALVFGTRSSETSTHPMESVSINDMDTGMS